MKKFILADKQGNTCDQQHIETGKYHSADSNIIDQSVAAIMNSGHISPILAVMKYPGVIDDGLKMFLLNVWDLDGEEYSIVKEVKMPVINSENKLVFAIKAVGAIYDIPEYEMWADNWTRGTDRSKDGLEAIQNKVKAEIAELENVQEVAYSMGLDLDEKDGVKKALFERAKIVFHAAEAFLDNAVQIFNDDVSQVFNGIEEFVNPEKLSDMSDGLLKAA